MNQMGYDDNHDAVSLLKFLNQYSRPLSNNHYTTITAMPIHFMHCTYYLLPAPLTIKEKTIFHLLYINILKLPLHLLRASFLFLHMSPPICSRTSCNHHLCPIFQTHSLFWDCLFDSRDRVYLLPP